MNVRKKAKVLINTWLNTKTKTFDNTLGISKSNGVLKCGIDMLRREVISMNSIYREKME